MKREDIKKFLIRHLEKLAFAAVSVVILAYLISLAVTTSVAESGSARVDKLIEDLKERERQTEQPEILPPKWHDQAKEKFDYVPKSESQITWFAYKIPFLAREVAVEPEPVRIHLPPQLISVVAEAYSVTLKWQPNPENKGIEIVEYTVKRLLPTDPEEEAVVVEDHIPRDRTTCKDTKGVQPDEKYIYWIEELAEEDDSRGQSLKEDQKSVSSEKVEVTTKSNIKISGILLDNFERPTTAHLEVTITKRDGTLVKETIPRKIGQEIIVTDPETKQEIKTGWTVKAFGMKPPQKRVEFVIIVNAKGEEKEFPPDTEP